MNLNIGNDWDQILKDEFSKTYFKEILSYLKNQKEFYPSFDQVFNAFKLTSFKSTKVVIIGQDPYHGEGQAHGLAFSVMPEVPLPPSLKNIYKEIESEFNIEMSKNGDLCVWAKQGVLLLNNVLTVAPAKAGSHQKIGWEKFTDFVLESLNQNKKNVVYMLWGSPAQKKAAKIDKLNNKVLESVHPSPLSAYRGFFGNNHFRLCNEYLLATNQKEIEWKN